MMMKPTEPLSRYHRKREREHVRTVRWALKHKNYVEAFQHLAWALQQSTAADAALSTETRDKVRKAMTKARVHR